jgi:predicted Zn-dependent protease
MTKSGFRELNGEPAQINGLNAYLGLYQGTLEGLGNSGVLAAHIVHNENVYMLAGLAPTNQFDAAQREFESAIRSFRGLSTQEAAQIKPNRVDVYTVRGGDTWDSIAKRTGDDTIKASTLAIMNDYEPNQQPRAGDRIKVVVQG